MKVELGVQSLIALSAVLACRRVEHEDNQQS